MATNNDNIEKLKARNARQRVQISNLRLQLAEMKELLKAIHEGGVDAFVIGDKDEAKVFTLKGAERPFRTVVETMNEGAATLTDDGLILYCNHRFAEIIGLEINNILGRNIKEFVNEPSRIEFDHMAKACYQINVRGELTINAQDGKAISVYAALSPLEEQEIPSLCLVITDISDLKAKAKELLEESETRFRLLLEGIKDYAIIGLDSSGRIESWNAGAERLKGYKAGEIMGVHISRFYPPEDIAAKKPERDLAIAAEKGQYKDEGWRVAKDGKYFWASGLTTSLLDKLGKLQGFVKIIQDTTDRKAAQDALANSEKQSRAQLKEIEAIYKSAHIGLCVLDRELRYIRINDRLAEMNGVSVAEHIGKTTRQIVPGLADMCEKTAGCVFETGKPVLDIEFSGTTRSQPGVTRYWIGQWMPLKDGSGQITGINVAVEEVTGRKQAEKQLLASEERLVNQTKELEAIIGVVSHDLRAPLVNVRGFNKFIKDDTENIKNLLCDNRIPQEIAKELKPILEESIPEATRFIESSADSMDTLVKSLVDVARAGMAVIKPDVLDMNAIVRGIITNLEIKFKRTGADIYIDNLPGCWGDKAQVTQIFSNLIDNAVKYLDPNRPGKICVGGQVEKDHVIYCVADNGIGIDLKDQKKIFEIFTRLAEKAHAGGEGMGLAMVKRMIARNNGQIWLLSEKGKGSNFFVSLPLHQ